MIQVELLDQRVSQAWKNLRNPSMDYIEKDGFTSLLEAALEQHAIENPLGELPSLFERLKAAMTRFWGDESFIVPSIAKKDITHNRRILFYIESLLFPRQSQPAADRAVALYPELDVYGVFVLLCAVYLHDYGKGQFHLLTPELPRNHPKRNLFRNSPTAASFRPDEYDLLERYHTRVISQFLDIFMAPHSAPEMIALFNEKYQDKNLQGYINAIQEDPQGMPEDAAEAQRQLYWVLWKLACHPPLPDGRSLLKEIQVVCRSHKECKLLNDTGDEPPRDYFTEIETDFLESNTQRRVRLLSALLRTGDNLDLTRVRLQKDGTLLDTFNKWIERGAPEGEFSPAFERLFSKWATFAAVQKISVTHRIPETATKPKPEVPFPEIIVEIVLTYVRFSNWQKHFLTLRQYVEKDFLINHYLEALRHSQSGQKLTIHLLYELTTPLPIRETGKDKEKEKAKEETDKKFRLDFSGALDKLFLAMRPQPVLRPEERYGFVTPTAKSVSPLIFSPLPDELALPSNPTLLYLLAFLETFGRTPCDTIARRMGLAEVREFPFRRDIINAAQVLRVDESLLEIREEAQRKVKVLLQVFREHPTLMRRKVAELDFFGHLLPFSLREVRSIPTGIDGLDKIVRPQQHPGASGAKGEAEPEFGFEHARNILVVGGPGNGKTTLLLQILHHNLHSAQRNVLMLTFEELVSVLVATDREHFGWEIDFVRNIQLEPDQKFEAVLARILSLVSHEDPDLLALDGLSRLRWMYKDDYREFIDTLFKALQIRGITSLSSIEEPPGNEPAEQYQADGVIHLAIKDESRRLRIEKLRSQDYINGFHAVEILDRSKTETGDDKDSPFQPGINVYPNEQYYASTSDRQSGPEREKKPKYIPTGVEGLDRLLPGRDSGQEGYRKGEAILVLGSPGAGKTLFGLHFLKAALGRQSEHLDNDRVLWLSFEGPLHLLKRSVDSFDEGAGFEGLLDKEKQPEFMFEFIPPALISPEKVLFQVSELVRVCNVRRIVIDSVSEIQQAFPKPVDFRQYMTTFIHTLAGSEVTSMFLYRVPGFFRTARESEPDIATLVDTIISIKTFDMKNKVRRGLFVLKSRGREHRSQLQTMEIHPKDGIQVSDKGWEMQGLLSGETGDIYEPEVFLKHFYENQAETAINVLLAAEFDRRYHDKSRFTAVRKAAVSSEFWSFRGHHGAGHANIRVISINRYMVEAFREREARLHTLEEFFPEHLREQMKKDVRWNRYATRERGYDSIPMYTDMGFLVIRRGRAEALQPEVSKSKIHDGKALLTLGNDGEVSWTSLRELAVAVARSRVKKPKEGPFVFALPYLYNQTEFMAFFFEILWSQGGDVYHFPIFDDPQLGRDMFYRTKIYFNKHVWSEFEKILGWITETPDRAFYSLTETCKRLDSLCDFFEKKYSMAILATDTREQLDILDRLKESELHTLLDSISDQLRRFITCTMLPLAGTFIENSDIITINNRFGYQALAFLYDLVFGETQGAIPNPYSGEFRDEAVFSRHWYSQIQGIRQGLAKDDKSVDDKSVDDKSVDDKSVDDKSVTIFPLPYFEEGGRKRSCTCETVWCLSLVKEALSPEIGWIYIDTLTSREWTEKRARRRLGFPYRLEEIKPMRQHDPQAYDLLDRIAENKRRKDRVFDAQQKLAESAKDVTKACEEFFSGKYHDRDIGDVLAYFNQHPELEAREQAFRNHLSRQPIDFAAIDEQVKEKAVSGLSEFEDSGAEVALLSKLPEHRPWFHRVEAGLHDEIVKLFSPQGRRDWLSSLDLKVLVVGMENAEIDHALAGMKETLIREALKRMHDRLVFDLLTALPSDLREQWPRPIPPD